MFYNKNDSIVEVCKIKVNLTFRERGLTIPLLVFWPYSVFGQNHLYVKML
jgi:hypothetical protein